MTEIKVISDVVDQCSKSQLESVFAPILDLTLYCTKA
jgi:hypothetical protein